MQEVKWRGLQTSVIIGPDHRPNLKTILPEKTANAAGAPAAPMAPAATAVPAATTAPTKADEFPVQLGALVLENVVVPFRR